MSRVHQIHHPLYVDSGLGQFGVEIDHARHVEQLMMQILMTSPGERINRPDFGCGIRRMVFAPNSMVSASLTKVAVFQALERWLGTLIKVDNVEVQAQNEKLEVGISYILYATREKKYLNLEIAV
jgi:uncharacterized protein